MRGVWEGLAGLCLILKVVLLSRGRLRGRYWLWRHETAFGGGPRISRIALARSVWAYARWVGRMHRMQKSRSLGRNPV